jgi:hypothetical protein
MIWFDLNQEATPIHRKVFISYRREDSAGYAGRLHDRLVQELGDVIFMDVDGIPLGVDFVERLTKEVASCDVLLAMIGPRWINIRDKKKKRRLDNPRDFVRVEISAALQRDIPVIPILVEGTEMPGDHLLPEDMKPLAVRNGLNVDHASFHTDLARLIRELKRLVVDDRTTPDQAKVRDHPTSAKRFAGVDVETDLQATPTRPLSSKQSSLHLPDVAGAWRTHWLSIKTAREHTATLVIPDNHGPDFTASMTVTYERKSQKTIIQETLTGSLREGMLHLSGVNYTYVERGNSVSNSLDNFELRPAEDGKALVGTAVLRNGARDVTFVRLPGAAT